MSWLPTSVVFGLVAASITTAGLLAALWRTEWTRARVGLFAAFAAGVLVTVSLLHLTPEALAMSSHGPALLLVGFVSGFLLNRGVLALAEGRSRPELAAGLTPALGIAAHSFTDGVVYAVTFSVNFSTGLLSTIGLVLHEMPEGVITFALLRGSGFSTGHAFWIAFFAAAVTTPLGAAVAHPFIASIDGPMLGDLFALAAGLLLYVSAGHLLPHVERERSRLATPVALIGGAVGIAMTLTHSHGEHGAHGGHGHAHEAHDNAPAHGHHDHDHHDHGDHDHDHDGHRHHDHDHDDDHG